MLWNLTFIGFLYHKSVFEDWIKCFELRDKQNNRLVVHSLGSSLFAISHILETYFITDKQKK